MRRLLTALALLAAACNGIGESAERTDSVCDSFEKVQRRILPDTSRFVVVEDMIPWIEVELRYCGCDNFMGVPVDGYQEETAILTREAALALKNICDSLRNLDLGVRIYDAYRPKRAVAHFRRWSRVLSDTTNKQRYYPNLDKGSLFGSGYLSSRSNHTHGSTVDLTLVSLTDGMALDMGSDFDLMDERSHYSYRGLTDEQRSNRLLLRRMMMWGGYSPIESEWWHFRLRNEPYSEEFDFPVNRDSIP